MIWLNRAVFILPIIILFLAAPINTAFAQAGCHPYATFASAMAESRDQGILIRKAMENADHTKSNEKQKQMFKAVVIDVYGSDVSPNDTYIEFYKKCMNNLSMP